ncbi:MAG: SixA phosphatase family protein [Acidimicrobiales bacterium]
MSAPESTSDRSDGLFLWLLRHAKAVLDVPAGGSDHDRPLAPRGRRDAAALGLRLRAGELGFGADAVPGLVLASTAARTSETAQAVASALGLPVERRRRLYYGSPTDMLDELRTLEDGPRAVMVVGHNPATHALALELLADDDEAGRAGLDAFATCAVALLRAAVGKWRDLEYGTATLVGFSRPPYDR